jgi:hypothetical protein
MAATTSGNFPTHVRPVTIDVKDEDGVIATVTYAGCKCPDQTHRDIGPLPHFCKHLEDWYGTPSNVAMAKLVGAPYADVPSWSVPGLLYRVRFLNCSVHGMITPSDLCKHVTAAYAWRCGWVAIAAEPVAV